MDELEIYLLHVRYMVSMRELARREKMYASTILRKIRRIEQARDDIYVDQYLEKTALGDIMCVTLDNLRLLCQPCTFIAAARGMDTAIIMQKDLQLGSISAIVLGEWCARKFIELDEVSLKHKVTKYYITEKGRQAAMKDSLPLTPKERLTKEKTKRKRRKTEHPINALTRRKGRDGQPFITQEEYRVAFRLNADFHQALMPGGKPATMNWDLLGTKVDHAPTQMLIPISWFKNNTSNRFEMALKEVGIGLSDILLLYVCYEHGLEECENRLGWPSRSGKIVLKIALERLVEFYSDVENDFIG